MRKRLVLVALGGGLLFCGCRSTNSDSTNSTCAELPQTCRALIEREETTCKYTPEMEVIEYVVAQDGCTATIVSETERYDCRVTENRISCDGVESTTAGKVERTINGKISEETLSGTVRWTWTPPPMDIENDPCEGRSRFRCLGDDEDGPFEGEGPPDRPTDWQTDYDPTIPVTRPDAGIFPDTGDEPEIDCDYSCMSWIECIRPGRSGTMDTNGQCGENEICCIVESDTEASTDSETTIECAYSCVPMVECQINQGAMHPGACTDLYSVCCELESHPDTETETTDQSDTDSSTVGESDSETATATGTDDETALDTETATPTIPDSDLRDAGTESDSTDVSEDTGTGTETELIPDTATEAVCSEECVPEMLCASVGTPVSGGCPTGAICCDTVFDDPDTGSAGGFDTETDLVNVCEYDCVPFEDCFANRGEVVSFCNDGNACCNLGTDGGIVDTDTALAADCAYECLSPFECFESGTLDINGTCPGGDYCCII